VAQGTPQGKNHRTTEPLTTPLYEVEESEQIEVHYDREIERQEHHDSIALERRLLKHILPKWDSSEGKN